jgi:hypothetical protein
MKKKNKIIVCQSSFEEDRNMMVAKTLVNFGFAKTPGDAKKIMAYSVFDIDLDTTFFVAAGTFNFRKSPNTTYRLFEMALYGNLVVVGTNKLPSDLEFMCDIYTINDFR